MIEIQTNKTFYAKGIYYVSRKSIPVQLLGSYRSYSTDPIEVHIWTDDESAGEVFNDSMQFPYFVRFDGRSKNGEAIWMDGIRPFEITGNTQLRARVGIFIQGDLESKAKPNEKIQIHSITTFTPLLIPDWSYCNNYDGTISVIGNKRERNGICWNNYQGNAQFIDNYEYINGEEDNMKFSLRLQTNSLFLTIYPTKEMGLKTVLQDLPESLNEDLQLLSFIGRKRIVCTEATARFTSENKIFFSSARYQTFGGFYSYPSDLRYLRSIIKHSYLKQGLFKSLIINYRESQYKSIIDRTIPFLLTSYEDVYVETQLVNAYAALESMVDGISESYGKKYLTTNNQFKRISKKIGNFIRQELSDEDVLNGMLKKIPELRRRSFLDCLLSLIDLQDINTKLIWPQNTDEPNEFHEILVRRNSLIHTGKVENSYICKFDLNRIQKLVELWILKLLDCPSEAIDEYSLWCDAPINKVLHY